MHEDRDDRFAIEGDREDALRELLRSGPDTMTGEDMARKHGVDGLALRKLIRANHDEIAPGHDRYEITREIEARILALPEFQALPER